MSDVPICPPWWPDLLWKLHFIPRPHGPGPINYPPVIESIMSGLHIHTMSYLMMDQAAAHEIRRIAEQQLTHQVQNLHGTYEEARKKAGMKP